MHNPFANPFGLLEVLLLSVFIAMEAPIQGAVITVFERLAILHKVMP